MKVVRVLPNSKAVEALVVCYERERVYEHEGVAYFVKSLDVIGKGPSTRVQAELEPAWRTEGEL